MTLTDDTSTGPARGADGAAGAAGAAGACGAATPVGVVAAARATVAELAETLWAARSPGELVATVRELEALRASLDAVELAVLGEVEATRAASAEQWASTADFLTHAAGARKGYGPTMLRLARALPERPATAAGMLAGWVSRDQALVITRTLDLLPGTAALRDAAEEILLGWAREVDAAELEARAQQLLERLDPDGVAAREEQALARLERAAHRGRFLSLIEDHLGGVIVKGRGTTEDAAIIKTALATLTRPDPNHHDRQTCRDHQDPRACQGCEGCEAPGADPREYPTRLWDAWVEACQRLLDTQVLPETHGTKPRLTITVDYHTLTTGLGAATLEVGLRLSTAAVRRLCCDAELIPAVLGTHAEVLDLGRAARLVTPALWKALVTRDKHCRFPGCTRPPIACDAHHIISWLDGGPTSLDNLVLLCRAHHTTIHHTPWRVRLNPHDHHPEFIPPGHTHPTRHRPRHPGHHITDDNHPADSPAPAHNHTGSPSGDSPGGDSRSGAPPPPRPDLNYD